MAIVTPYAHYKENLESIWGLPAHYSWAILACFIDLPVLQTDTVILFPFCLWLVLKCLI